MRQSNLLPDTQSTPLGHVFTVAISEGLLIFSNNRDAVSAGLPQPGHGFTVHRTSNGGMGACTATRFPATGRGAPLWNPRHARQFAFPAVTHR
jgi:hypothetical protein